MKNKILILAVTILTSLTASSQYCTPTYTNPCVSSATNDLIDNFWTTGASQDISNLNTSCNGIYDNTGLTMISQPGTIINLNVQCGATYAQGFSIWVDWNQDFTFDPGENIYQSPNSGFNVFTGSFTIPADIDCGDYRMRVRSSYSTGGANIDPCANHSYGETEDYTITIDQCEPTICEGESHTIDMTGGMPPNVTSYSWAPATNISNPTGGPIVDVYPTDTTVYVCTITSPDSVWTQSHIINVVHLIEPNAGLDDSLCHSALNGYQLQPTLDNDGDFFWEFESGPPTAPGTPNAIFQPNNMALNATTLANYPGEYTYVLHESDTNNVCPDVTDTVKIYFSKETHDTTYSHPTCYGYEDGSIQIISTGTLGAVEYSFNGGASFTSSPDSINLGAGVYNVISRDYLGCESESVVTIIDPLEIILTVGPVTPDTTVCENGTATLYASAINGTTYDFHWNHTTDLAYTQNISPLGDSTVTVYAESELGCKSDTLPINVYVHAPIGLHSMENDTICPGYDAELSVSASGGFQGYNYSWTANGASYNDADNIINMTPIIETEYCVTVTDVCESTPKTTCAKVIMREVPVPMFTADTLEGCNPSIIQFSDITENGYYLAETETAQLNWLVDGTVYNDSLFDHLFENVGEYDVQLEVYTNFGCHSLSVAQEYISIHEVPVATFYVISNPSTIFNTEVEMVNNTQGINLTYQWSNPSGVPANSTLESPTVIYPEGIAADYPVELVVTNEFNCSDTTQDIVHIISDVIIYAPNAFTPDNDNLNNDWRVYIDGININEFHLLMFNRWGETVWESYDPEAVWDGTYGGKKLLDGTYVWSLIAKDATSDKKYEFRGHVSIIR